MNSRLMKAGGSSRRCTMARRDERWTHGQVALQETASHCRASKFKKYFRNNPLPKKSVMEIPLPLGRVLWKYYRPWPEVGVSLNEV